MVNLRNAKFVALRPLLLVQLLLLAGDGSSVSLSTSLTITLSLSLVFPSQSVKHVSAGTTVSPSSLNCLMDRPMLGCCFLEDVRLLQSQFPSNDPLFGEDDWLSAQVFDF